METLSLIKIKKTIEFKGFDPELELSFIASAHPRLYQKKKVYLKLMADIFMIDRLYIWKLQGEELVGKEGNKVRKANKGLERMKEKINENPQIIDFSMHCRTHV